MVAACSEAADEDTSPTVERNTATSETSTSDTTRDITASPTLFGVAGLIPPNFPDPTPQDWETLFGSFHETGPVVGVYQNWNDGPDSAGQIPEAVRVIHQLAEREAIVPLVGLGVKERTPDDGLRSTVDYDNPDERQQVIDTLTALVEEFEVEYLLFGAEINRLRLFDPAAFDGFVALYEDAYDAVKLVSPDTLMFTGFQLELMRGDAFLMGNSENRDPQWDLIELFEGRLDLLSFTVYPQLDFTDPADIPDDYLSSITQRFGLPLALTEIGWPSAPLGVPGAEGYGGTPEEQVAFIQRLGELMSGVDVRIAAWALPHDVDEFETPAFQTIAIRDNDGTAKPALGVWQALAGIRQPAD